AEEMTNALNELNETGEATDLNAIFNIDGMGIPGIYEAVEGIDDMGDALRRLDPETQSVQEGIQAFWTDLVGLPGPTKDAVEQFETLDTALSQMDADTAA